MNVCYDSIRGGKWIQECCNETMIIYAQEQSERQRLQQGRYILFPNDIKESGTPYFSKVISPIQKCEESIYTRLIIPKENKIDFASKLEIFGISKSTLFSDNIDIVCKSIVNDAHKRSKCKDNPYQD